MVACIIDLTILVHGDLNAWLTGGCCVSGFNIVEFVGADTAPEGVEGADEADERGGEG